MYDCLSHLIGHEPILLASMSHRVYLENALSIQAHRLHKYRRAHDGAPRVRQSLRRTDRRHARIGTR
jgi:hypothetical protein